MYVLLIIEALTDGLIAHGAGLSVVVSDAAITSGGEKARKDTGVGYVAQHIATFLSSS